MTFQTPVEVAIAPTSLRVLVPRQTQSRSLKESIDQLNERAILHLSGRPTLPSRDEVTARSPLLRRLHEFDEEVFKGIAEWESPPLDRLMPALSQAASHSKIWIAMAAAMSLTGGKKGRRTAVEGLAAVGDHLVSRQPGGQGPLPETATDRSGARGATSADAGFVLDALGPHRICRCIHSRRWRGISRSADPTQCPRRGDRILPGLHRSAPPHRCHIRLAPWERDRNAHTCDGCYSRTHSSLRGPPSRHRMRREGGSDGHSEPSTTCGIRTRRGWQPRSSPGRHAPGSGRTRYRPGSGRRHIDRLDQWCSPGTRPQRRSQSAVTRMAEDETRKHPPRRTDRTGAHAEADQDPPFPQQWPRLGHIRLPR